MNSDGTNTQEYPVRDMHSIIAWSADNNYLFFMDRDYSIYKAAIDFSTIEKMPLPYTITDPSGIAVIQGQQMARLSILFRPRYLTMPTNTNF